MTDNGRRLTRRAALQSGAVAAGFVWSVPAIRSVSRLTAVGSPGPSTSSPSTAPTVTHYDFAGDIANRVIAVDTASAQCVVTANVVYNTVLSTLGATSGSFFLCSQSLGASVDVTGQGSLSSAAGSVSGPVTGTVVTHPGATMGELLEDFHLEITITAGTGDFAGAVGTAVYDDHQIVVGDPEDPDAYNYEVHGEVTGSFDAPS